MAKRKQIREKDAYTIVLENIHSDFRVFGESLDFVRDETKQHTRRLDKIDEKLMKVEGDIDIMKSELALIRHNQITRDEFKFLETRVARLERKIK